MATLVVGLSDDSRIKRKISGQRLTLEQALMARMVDELSFIAWSKTKDGQRNRNRPESLLNKLLHPEDKGDKDEIETFESGADFERAWAEATRKGKDNG